MSQTRLFFFTKVCIAYKTKCRSSALNKQTKKQQKENHNSGDEKFWMFKSLVGIKNN